MFLKIMSRPINGERDSSPGGHLMVEVTKYDFYTNGVGAPTLAYTRVGEKEEDTLELSQIWGTVYVMNNEGRTIDHFCCSTELAKQRQPYVPTWVGPGPSAAGGPLPTWTTISGQAEGGAASAAGTGGGTNSGTSAGKEAP